MELTKELYDKHYRLLYNIARKMLFDDDMAKDAVHDTFIKFYGAKDIDEEKRIYFIVKILKNVCIDYYHKKGMTRSIEDMLELQQEEEYLNSYDRALLEGFIEEAINKLGDNQKEVFRYKYEIGLTYNEISKITNSDKQLLRNTYSYAKENIISFVKHLILEGTLSISKRRRLMDNSGAKIINNTGCRKILDKETGKILIGVKAAAAIINVKRATLNTRLWRGADPRFQFVK